MQPLRISNYMQHPFLSLFLVLPNAYAYYLLILVIDLLTVKKYITTKKLITLLIIRVALGFSPFIINTLALVLNLPYKHNCNLFYERFYELYTGILMHYSYTTLIKVEKGFIYFENTQYL